MAKGELIITFLDENGQPYEPVIETPKPPPPPKPVVLPPEEGWYTKEEVDAAFEEFNFDPCADIEAEIHAAIGSGAYVEDPVERAEHLADNRGLDLEDAWLYSVAGGIMAVEHERKIHDNASNGELNFKCFVPARESE